MLRTCLLAVALALVPVDGGAAPSVAPGVAGDFDLTDISDGFTASMAQMAFGPDGKLYVTTFYQGVVCFDYDPGQDLPAPTQAVDVRALGIAFHESAVHGTCMYLTPYLDSRDDPHPILRLTDDDGDGTWGEPGETNVAIVDNIPVGLHRMNQLQVRGDALFVGIGSRTDQGNDESAYNGTIAWIQDLDQVASTPNNAGFTGLDFFTDPTPFTSTATDKLVVHSAGTRNPFGLAVDGSGRLWMSNNQKDTSPTPQDEFFLAAPFADYGFPASNPSTDWRTHPAVLAAGHFGVVTPSLTVATPDPSYIPDDPTPTAAPGGLGPNSSADGFTVYDANAFPLRFHHDAFLARASSSATLFTGLPETYQDFVAIDLDTGEVVQIADDFTRPLDVVQDPAGQLLFAEFDAGGQGLGRIYRLSADVPVTGTHAFQWGSTSSGAWSDRLQWNPGLPADDRLVPNAWNQERYDVTVDVAGGSPTVTVDAPTRVESLTVADGVAVDAPLTIQDQLTLLPGAQWTVVLRGPTPGEDFHTVEVEGVAQLSGGLEVVLANGYLPPAGMSFEILRAAQVQGSFSPVTGPGSWTVEVVGDRVWLRAGSGTGTPGPPLPWTLRVAPNPFNPSTTIHLGLARPGHVEVRIHDAAGRMVRRLRAETMDAGDHRVVWDGRDAQGRRSASGVYFVQATVGGKSRSVRVSLVK